MEQSTVADRKATATEVREPAVALRQIAATEGLGTPRRRDDGTVIVHSDEDGYRATNRLSAKASLVVGTYVHVITDDAPGARSAPISPPCGEDGA